MVQTSISSISTKSKKDVNKTKHPKKKRKQTYEDKQYLKLQAQKEEEEKLTALCFGGLSDAGGADPFMSLGGGGGAAVWEDEDDESTTMQGIVHETEEVDVEEMASGGLFQIDRKGVSLQQSSTTDENSTPKTDLAVQEYHEEKREEKEEGSEPAAAWVDEDDADIRVSLLKHVPRSRKMRMNKKEDDIDGNDYEQRLRSNFQSYSSNLANTNWADTSNIVKDAINDASAQSALIPKDDAFDSEEDDYGSSAVSISKLLSSTAPILSNFKLQPNRLRIERCVDANMDAYSQCSVMSTRFNPGGDVEEPLLFTAGMDKHLRFFKVGANGDESRKVHSVFFDKAPITSAEWLGSSGKIVLSRQRPFYHIYDAEAGKTDMVPEIYGRKEKSLEKFAVSPDGTLIAFLGEDGYIIIVEAKTKMWVMDLKINGSVRDVSFTPDSEFILASGSDGEIYRWDLRSKRCVDRFKNEDGMIVCNLASTSQHLAVAAESGVVNIYNEREFSIRAKEKSNVYDPFEMRTPMKSIMNIKTPIDHMRFNHDGDILAISSRTEKNVLKLVHMPTQTVFSNWPTVKTPINYCWSFDFSPDSRFMAIGNDKGKCLLYRLAHYVNTNE